MQQGNILFYFYSFIYFYFLVIYIFHKIKWKNCVQASLEQFCVALKSMKFLWGIRVLAKQVKCRCIFTVYLHSWTTRCSQTGCMEHVASSWNCDHIDTTARKQWLAGSACLYRSSCDMLRAVPRTVSRSIYWIIFGLKVFFMSALSGTCSFFLVFKW